MQFSLRTKIWLLLVGTVTGLTSVTLVALTILSGWEIDNAVRNDVRTTGSVLGQFLHERSQMLQDDSLLLARQTATRQLIGSDADRATFTDYARSWLKQLHADAARITDGQGRLLGETDTRTAFLADQTQDSGVLEALQGRIYTGVLQRKGRLMLAVTVPVADPASKIVQGTFTAYSAIDTQIAPELKETLSTDLAFVHEGRVIGASILLPARLPTPESAPQVVKLGGQRFFVLYAPLPYADPKARMGFVVLRPYDAAMGIYAPFQLALVGVSALALMLALAIGTAVARNLTRPLDGVLRAARVVREGGWPERFEVRRQDELGLLQSAFNEMTEAMRASQERLLALIDTDPLTGLDNHRRFQERLAQEAKRSAASGEPLSLLLFDLDEFQQFNQQYGHAAGDEALQRVALILRSCLPEVAILARFGGEEFAALLPQQSCRQAEELAERVRAVVASSRPADVILTVSVGCAELGLHSAQPEGLVLAAELAVSRAKQLGRNRVCRFDSISGDNEMADPYQLHAFLKDGSLATIQALAAAVDAKDSYTQGHSRRVAEYAADLARYVGLPKGEADLVYITGTLHDVGKIGVPDAVLQKPGRLTAEERAIIETHPILGEIIVRKAPQLAPTLPGVRHHHERWDGMGYPDRLSGRAIPYLARILAIADTFDAMTSDRPYRAGMPRERALEEIAQSAGTQFDPDLAQAFVAMMRAHSILAHAA
ncbi:MAG TPA: HD domain-containing phosphohydrolase [Chthonomonadaceae bacterium]|nr:HD domain-containing phosphohydrolase [Chthonomonadaceae bacterium]